MNGQTFISEIHLPGTLSSEAVTNFIERAHILHPKALAGDYDLQVFGAKLASYAHAIILKRTDSGQWVGGCFGYCNNTETKVAYISFIAKTIPDKGLGRQLMDAFCALSKRAGMHTLRLEVNSRNTNAQAFYHHYGLVQKDVTNHSFYMEMPLN